ncbi:MAG: hypothetical protein AAFN44_16805, partial [Pseudomonadota bacterium]
LAIMLDPAKTVIEICGGVNAVAEITGRHPSRVHRWGYTKDRGGSDGFIPSEVASLLLEKASHLGLKPEHFFKTDKNSNSSCPDHAVEETQTP